MLSATARVRRGFRRLGIVAAGVSVLIGGIAAFAYLRDYLDGPMVYCGSGRGYERVLPSSDREAEFIRLTTLCPPDRTELVLGMSSPVNRAAIQSALDGNASMPGYAVSAAAAGVAVGAALWAVLELLSWLIRGFMRE